MALLLASGCRSRYAAPGGTFSHAVAPVVDQASAAYASANSLHNLRVDYDAYAKFDLQAPVYNPRDIQVLLSAADIKVRLDILAALQCYAKAIVALSAGTDTPALQDASKTVGTNLSALGTSLGASFDPTVVKSVDLGIDGFTQFLIARKTDKALPAIIKENDPRVAALCNLIEGDIAILKDQEDRDYNFIIREQSEFVRVTKTLDAGQRRDLIMKLPEIVRQQKVSSEQLTLLSAAVDHLKKTHAALLAAALTNKPETLKQKVGDLEFAGNDLGTFYSSIK